METSDTSDLVSAINEVKSETDMKDLEFFFFLDVPADDEASISNIVIKNMLGVGLPDIPNGYVLDIGFYNQQETGQTSGYNYREILRKVNGSWTKPLQSPGIVNVLPFGLSFINLSSSNPCKYVGYAKFYKNCVNI